MSDINDPRQLLEELQKQWDKVEPLNAEIDDLGGKIEALNFFSISS